MKKSLTIILLTIILILPASCTKTDKPIHLTLTIDQDNIQYTTLQNNEDNPSNDRKNIFKSILQKTKSEEIKHIQFGKKAILDFGKNPPDKISIKDSLLESNGEYMLDEKFTKEVPFTKEKNKYCFTIEQNFSSGFFQAPGQKTVIRGYRIDAYWDKIGYSYGFVIKTDPIVYLE